jgi:uncharacterized protein DUF4154
LTFRLLSRVRAVLIMIVLSATCPLVRAQNTVGREYNIKAVFIYNFTQFVTWPDAAFTAPSSPFVIAIVGRDPFGSVIDETVAGEKVNGHPIVIQRYTEMKEIKNAHILFVSRDEASAFYKWLPELKTRRMLTVSDTTGFAAAGGMIRFLVQDNKIKLQINLSATREAGLEVSSKLLRVAEIVEPQK